MPPDTENSRRAVTDDWPHTWHWSHADNDKGYMQYCVVCGIEKHPDAEPRQSCLDPDTLNRVEAELPSRKTTAEE